MSVRLFTHSAVSVFAIFAVPCSDSAVKVRFFRANSSHSFVNVCCAAVYARLLFRAAKQAVLHRERICFARQGNMYCLAIHL